jgi:hypothetical protein
MKSDKLPKNETGSVGEEWKLFETKKNRSRSMRENFI